ncbi:Arm DNA-binding domain-containing protein [Photobacterium profundum]|uniref:Arm DNA-binding domain-containing protein n=1 Tax=Photobacterium profundum TaxID=74109 RepID=UPI003D1208EF
MGVLNVRNDKLVIQFRYKGQRCREQTQLINNTANRKRLDRLLIRIEAEIILNTFDYQKYFPNSKAVNKFTDVVKREQTARSYFAASYSPKLEEFAQIWLAEMKIEWSKAHCEDVEGVLNKYILPTFGNKKISAINKTQILQFRSILAKVPGRKGSFLSPSRINHIMTPLRVLLNEAADRYDFTSPWRNIKALKIGRTEIDPFSLQEVELVLNHVPNEYYAYYITRFFTGMRTGEVDALMWGDIDFTNKTLTVQRSLRKGELSGLKTEGSHRVINLIDRVVDILIEHKKTASLTDNFVFTNSKRKPLNYQVVSRSVWYPALLKAKLRPRNPYQTRHTFATLLLASGESPEWIANQMGHTTTTMLFRVYSRFVPNLTRRDGSAFSAFLARGVNA